jgi:hypothetical protein
MTIKELILILQNRLANNAQQRQIAVERGDVDAIGLLDDDSASTSVTLNALIAAAA